MASPKCCLSAVGSFKHLVSFLVFGMLDAFSEGENQVRLSFLKSVKSIENALQHFSFGVNRSNVFSRISRDLDEYK